MADGQAVKTITLRVEGMGCDGCVRSVRDVLVAVAGVRHAEVDLGGGTASVEALAGVDPASLVAAVDEAGYEAAIA